MALAAVSFKVVILLLFIHCMMLLPFDGFVFVTCFVVEFLVWVYFSNYIASDSWLLKFNCIVAVCVLRLFHIIH